MAERYTFQNRYVFEGELVMQTAFHIGGGKATLSNSNSPVVLTPEGLPFIPGSSFKGALRSTVEKFVSSLPTETALTSCALIEKNKDELQQARDEATTDEDYKKSICPTIRQAEITRERRSMSADDEKAYMQELHGYLCSTCKLFGSPFAASHININDLYITEQDWAGLIQRRDGVAIDRDSEKAKDRLKYDFEVVPASSVFKLQITLENATLADLQLTCLGLSEFANGFGAIGGKRSRGLGACLLTNLTVSELVLSGIDRNGQEVNSKTRNERLKNYLLKREFSLVSSGEEFLGEYIKKLFTEASK